MYMHGMQDLGGFVIRTKETVFEKEQNDFVVKYFAITKVE